VSSGQHTLPPRQLPSASHFTTTSSRVSMHWQAPAASKSPAMNPSRNEVVDRNVSVSREQNHAHHAQRDR
jgi:hypothetical protein